MKTTYLFMLCLFIQYGLKAQTEINWVNAKNITIKGDKLIKNGDVKAWWNAGIASEEAISPNNDGWTQATITKPKGAKILGLSSQNKEFSWDTVEFGLYVKGNGTIQILEKGKIIFTSKVKVVKGDIVKVERKSGKILYKRNNTIVFTSKKSSKSVLFTDISMYAAGAEFSGLSMSSNSKKNSKEITVDAPLHFKKFGSRITVEKVTEADIAAIQKIEGKKYIKIRLGPKVSQEEFTTLCTALPWIQKFDFGSAAGNIENLDPLHNLTDLEELYFGYLRRTDENPIDLSPLENANNLRIFSATGISFINTDVLISMDQLELFTLATGNLDSYDFLDGKMKLKVLEVPNNTDMPEVYVKISRLESLEDLHLHVGKQGLTDTDLTTLENLKNLIRLYVPGVFGAPTSSLNVSHFKGMKQLAVLWLPDFSITDLTPLSSCKELDYLEVHKTTPQSEIDKLKRIFPELDLRLR